MIIEVRARPGSKKEIIEKISEKVYKISLKEKAEDNKANIKIIKILKKYFNKDVKIIKGLKSKNKVVKVG